MTTDGLVVAEVSADVLEFGDQRLLVESSLGTALGFRVRATGADGSVFTMRKISMTVAKIEADCEGRTYTLHRTNPWRKRREIRDGEDRVVAHSRSLVGGRLVLDVIEDIPTADFFFMAFGLLLVDVPTRNMRY